MIDTKPQTKPTTMNEKTETPEPIAAILAAMRHRAENHRLDGWESVAEELDDLCDRIEAAYKREHAEWHAETEAAKDARNRIACKMRYEFAAKCRNCTERAPGNAAAMRAALVEVEGAIFEDEPCRFWLADAEVILHKVQAALAAPARNCDRFACRNDAWVAFKRRRNNEFFDTMGLHNFTMWLFAPAEGGDHA